MKVSYRQILHERASGGGEWPSEVSAGRTSFGGPTMKGLRSWAEMIDADLRAASRGQRRGAPAPALRRVPVR